MDIVDNLDGEMTSESEGLEVNGDRKISAITAISAISEGKYLQNQIRNDGILKANAKHWYIMPDFKSIMSSKKNIFKFLFNLFLLSQR